MEEEKKIKNDQNEHINALPFDVRSNHTLKNKTTTYRQWPCLSREKALKKRCFAKSFLIEFINKYDFPFIENTNTY